MPNPLSSRIGAGVLVLAVAISLSGCGGSTHPAAAGAVAPTATSSAGQTAGEAASPISTTAARATSTKHEARARDRAHSPARTQRQPVASTRRRFIALANAVCRTVRIGAPGPVPPGAPAARITAYARAALPAARRTAVSLRRIGARAGHDTAFGEVARDFDFLGTLYLQAVGRGNRGHALLSSIGSAERRASSDARRAGLPACAPGRDAGEAPGPGPV